MRLSRKQAGSATGQLALRRLTLAPDHAYSFPEHRPASAGLPLGQRRPAIPAFDIAVRRGGRKCERRHEGRRHEGLSAQWRQEVREVRDVRHRLPQDATRVSLSLPLTPVLKPNCDAQVEAR